MTEKLKPGPRYFSTWLTVTLNAVRTVPSPRRLPGNIPVHEVRLVRVATRQQEVGGRRRRRP